MNIIIEFFKKFIATRNILFYVALGISAVSVIVGIVAVAGLSAYGTAWPVILLTVAGFVAFVALSLHGKEGMGAGVMAACIFAALLFLIVGEYSYFLTEIQGQAMSDGFDLASVDGLFLLIAVAVLLLVCAVAANVFAWLHLSKKQKEPAADDVLKEEKSA